MKKFVLLFVSLIMLSSCSTTLFNLSLNSVEYPSNSKEKYSETKIVKVESDGLSKYKYEDDFIKILWYVTAKQFHFELTNKSSYTIKLPWDDMAYIDEVGNTRRVMHNGVKFIDRNNAQPASVLPKNASISDLLLPTDNVYYLSSVGWIQKNLFSVQAVEQITGKTVRILFPIIIQDVPNEYMFEFKIDSTSEK